MTIVRNLASTVVAVLTTLGILNYAKSSPPDQMSNPRSNADECSLSTTELAAHESFDEAFRREHILSIMISPINDEVFTTKTVNLVADLTASAWDLPYVRRVQSLTNHQHSYADYDEFDVQDLFPSSKEVSISKLLEGRRIALSSPELLHYHLSQDAKHTVVQVLFRLPKTIQVDDLQPIVEESRSLIDEFEKAYPQVRFGIVPQDDFTANFDENDRLHADAVYFENHIGALKTLNYALPAGRADGIFSPTFLTAAAAFTKWLRQQPEVRSVRSLTDRIMQLNMNMHDDDPTLRKLPQTSEAIAQALFLFELSMGHGLDLTEHINVDRSQLRISVGLNEMTPKETQDFKERTDKWFQVVAPKIRTAPVDTNCLR